MPVDFLAELVDSKTLSEKKRLLIYQESLKNEIIFGVGSATAREIDRFNILNATMMAMARAVNQCIIISKLCFMRKFPTDEIFYNILVDGINCPKKFGHTHTNKFVYRTVRSGDKFIPEVSCASIIAKVIRDKEMSLLDRSFPDYGFRQNKGYGTKQHIEALKKNGPIFIHRYSFKPLRKA